MKRQWLVCLLILGGLLSVCLPAQAAMETTPQLIRLHVSANGESLREQQVKMQVRDDLLVYLDELLVGVSDQAEALRLLKAALADLTAVATESLERQGESYGASLQLGEFNFPAKHYGTFTLPAGRYQALNVTLGSGAGRNWWCVVFPPMCLTAGVCEQNEQADDETLVLHSWLWDRWNSVLTWLQARF